MKSDILFINGSASADSSNHRLIHWICGHINPQTTFSVYHNLRLLPHFDPQASASHPPQEVIAFRQLIERASVVVFCTPEYIFSIPDGLKNALEWCVASTVFDKKKVAVITASAHGEKGHAELQLILQTLGAQFDKESCLLINGVKAKISLDAQLTHESTKNQLHQLIAHIL